MAISTFKKLNEAFNTLQHLHQGGDLPHQEGKGHHLKQELEQIAGEDHDWQLQAKD